MNELMNRARQRMRGRDDTQSNGDLRASAVALAGGAALGLVSNALLALVPREKARLLAGLTLAVAGGAYLGFGVADGRGHALAAQSGEFLAFGAAAYLGVQRQSSALLGAGWLAHAAWDALHTREGGPTRVPSWYPPACGAYDAAVGAALLKGRS